MNAQPATAQQLNAQNAQNLLALKANLAIPDTKWKARSSEQVLWVGKGTIASKGILVWTGIVGVTRDGIYYKFRTRNGNMLPDEADRLVRPGTGAWWSEKASNYFGNVWDTRWVEFLTRMGVPSIKVIDEDTARRNIPQDVSLVKVPMPVSTNVHMNGGKVDNVAVSDLPQGVTLNEQGRPIWDKGAPGGRYGQFISKEDLARLRQEQGIHITPAQQVSTHMAAVKEVKQVATQERDYSAEFAAKNDYEQGRYVAGMDDERGLGEVSTEFMSDEWARGYHEYFMPAPQVDEALIMSKLESALNDSMAAAIGGILENLKAQLKEALHS